MQNNPKCDVAGGIALGSCITCLRSVFRLSNTQHQLLQRFVPDTVLQQQH